MRYLRPTLAVAALALAGCGANAATESDATPRATIPSPTGASVPAEGGAASTTAQSSIVPAVDVIEVNSGRPIALRATIATDKPTLIWMWAPH